jgi:CRP-like cAMP-binding protein
MQRDEVARIIRTTLCRSLTPAQAVELAASTVPVGVPAGGFVFRHGDKSDGLLILVRGSVEISRVTGDGTPRTIATMNAPAVIGEMGLLTERPRSASVKAITACECHLLTRRDFVRMLEDEQLAAFKLVGSLADVLARRLEAADDGLVAIVDAAQAAQAAAPVVPPDVAQPPAPVAELAALREKLFSEWSF